MRCKNEKELWERLERMGLRLGMPDIPRKEKTEKAPVGIQEENPSPTEKTGPQVPAVKSPIGPGTPREEKKERAPVWLKEEEKCLESGPGEYEGKKELWERLDRLECKRSAPPWGSSVAETKKVWEIDEESEGVDEEISLEDSVGGKVEETPVGNCVVIEERLSIHKEHGGIALSCAGDYTPRRVGLMAKNVALSEMDLQKALFLDTETTGLGGSGTYVFLVGVGFFEREEFCFRQYFMRSPSEEAALVWMLEGLFARFNTLVTFNGKAFDVPLLQSRFTMQRKPCSLHAFPNLDLLTLARRLWKKRLSSCSLSSLEKHILGMEREGDVPGFMIPAIYWDYVRSRSAHRILPVLEHNRLDVLSMVSLLGRIGAILNDPATNDVRHSEDWHALGLCYQEMGLSEEAVLAYEQAISTASAPEKRWDIWTDLSGLHKQHRQWEKACSIWERMIESGSPDLYPYEELAKHYEHRLNDYPKALEIVQKALERIERKQILEAPFAQFSLVHRLQRIERKALC